MEKVRLILILSLSSFIIGSHGLQLSIYHETEDLSDNRLQCGVLSCVETTSQLPTDNLLHNANISSIVIFKTTSTASDDSDQSTPSVVMASLTLEQPTVTYASETLKIDGRLEDKQATLRIELTQPEDCQADFTCQVRAVDNKGKEFVTISRLRQHSKLNKTTAVDRRGQGYNSLRCLQLLHQINDKIISFEKLMQNEESKTYAVKENGMISADILFQQNKDLENRIDLLDREFKNKIQSLENRFEDKLELFDNKIDAFENRIEDKIQNNIGNKLWQVNEKLSARTNDEGKVVVDITQALKRSMLDLKETLLNEHKTNYNFLNGLSNRTEHVVNATLTSVMEASRQQSIRNQHNQVALTNLTKVVSEIFQRNENLEQERQNQLADLVDNFLQIGTFINSTTTETQTALQTTLHSSISTRREDIKAVMTTFIMPKTCRKGTVPILSQSAFPYPVIYPSEGSGLGVAYLCDTLTDGGGWIVIQRRTTGNVDFYRDWATYKKGFGSLQDDFWLGNDNIHNITSSGSYELRVELMYKGRSAYAQYKTFSIGDERENYELKLGAYSGTAGNSLSSHNTKSFSTYDRDNDLHSGNCAVMFTGAWWYGGCHASNLNGKWNLGSNKGLRWNGLSGSESVSFSEMKIRKVDP